jgi:glycosyltransferase involved in cell wall biosynthesis
MTLVVPTLGAGGTERIATFMANWWARAGHRVALITLDGPEDPPFFPIDAGVELVRLGLARPARGPIDACLANLGRIAALRRALRGRDGCVLSFIDVTNVLVLLAARGLPLPVVVAERTDPAAVPLSRIWKALRRRVYPRARLVVVQTEGARAALAPLVNARIEVIPNPVIGSPGAMSPGQTGPSDVASRADTPAGAEDGGRHWMLGVGRLSEEKGFDLLIHAFARVAGRHPAWHVRIIGDGPRRADLGRLAGGLGIADRVLFEGLRADVARWLSGSDLFVLPSRFEGFPNALCEAMAAGLPVVAFDCPSGPREIVRHDVDGLLVAPEDIGALAAALDRLMASADTRRRLGERAREVAARFAPPRIMSLWEQALVTPSAAPEGVTAAARSTP